MSMTELFVRCIFLICLISLAAVCFYGLIIILFEIFTWIIEWIERLVLWYNTRNLANPEDLKR